MPSDPVKHCAGWTAARHVLFAVLAAGVCQPARAVDPGPGSGAGPAQVENARPESSLTTLRLTRKAVERLGIRTVAMERRTRPRTRTVGGVIMTPPGHTIQVAAPNEGTVLGVDGDDLPYPGTSVRRGQPLLRLLVVSSGELARAREVLDVATARTAIAEQAVRGSTGSVAALDEREAARAALEVAQRRLRLLSGGGGPGAEGLAPVQIVAPVDGVVRSLTVSAGQAVPAGAPLLEIVLTDPAWVRVPIYAGDLRTIRPGSDAVVHRLAAPADEGHLAVRVAGPPSADPDSASVHLYFEVENPGGELQPGERVEVTLTLGTQGPMLSAPYAGVLYDINGGTWIYEQLDDTTFVRRRVEIAFVRDGQAVLARGPQPGTRVVVEGAAELFGTEFGIGK